MDGISLAGSVWPETSRPALFASVPLDRRLYEMNLDGLLALGRIVVLAISLPALRDNLDQDLALPYFRRTRDALLIRLQVELNFFLVGKPEINAGIGDRLVLVAAGQLDPQAAGRVAFVRSGRSLIGLRGERQRQQGRPEKHRQQNKRSPKRSSLQHGRISDIYTLPAALASSRGELSTVYSSRSKLASDHPTV